MQFLATITNGKLAIDTQDKWKRYLSGLNEGEKMSLDIEKRKNRRSISQNAYYWLYIGVIETETGNSASDLHAYFKRTHLPYKEKEMFGKTVRISASTTDLSKNDFANYLDKIAAECGVPLPDPVLAGYTPNSVQYSGSKEKVAYPTENITQTAFD